MQIYFIPHRKPFEFWKRNRYLKLGEDYLISHQRIVFSRAFKGKLEFEYDVRSN